jgi:hypothetical protein
MKTLRHLHCPHGFICKIRKISKCTVQHVSMHTQDWERTEEGDQKVHLVPPVIDLSSSAEKQQASGPPSPSKYHVSKICFIPSTGSVSCRGPQQLSLTPSHMSVKALRYHSQQNKSKLTILLKCIHCLLILFAQVQARLYGMFHFKFRIFKAMA